jgi:hypothetical protein
MQRPKSKQKMHISFLLPFAGNFPARQPGRHWTNCSSPDHANVCKTRTIRVVLCSSCNTTPVSWVQISGQENRGGTQGTRRTTGSNLSRGGAQPGPAGRVDRPSVGVAALAGDAQPAGAGGTRLPFERGRRRQAMAVPAPKLSELAKCCRIRNPGMLFWRQGCPPYPQSRSSPKFGRKRRVGWRQMNEEAG